MSNLQSENIFSAFYAHFTLYLIFPTMKQKEE